MSFDEAWAKRALTLQRGLESALDDLAEALRIRQFEAEIDPLHRARGEVLLGYASRLWRLAKYVCCNPALWSDERAAYEIRSIVDGTIVSRWFLLQDDNKFERFVEYGRGRLKLYKLHAEQFADKVGDGSLDDVLEGMSELVNADVLEEFQTINVGGAFPGENLRKMAEAAGIKQLYDLRYQPLSAEAHGQWDSLLVNDLGATGDPLYDGHRFGLFSTAEEQVDVSVVLEALLLALETIAAIFAGLGVDVQREVQGCWDEAYSTAKTYVSAGG